MAYKGHPGSLLNAGQVLKADTSQQIAMEDRGDKKKAHPGISNSINEWIWMTKIFEKTKKDDVHFLIPRNPFTCQSRFLYIQV